ncbi:MAG: hypothetical protein QM764_09280 [Chitinophagaceae bacterium]
MTDNINDDTSKNGAILQPENRSDEIDLSTDKQPIQLNQEVQNMEVHHHPKVEGKKFKEYFLEFLMIFLAVTMGFFAENIREKISDSRHVDEYVHSMVSDLKADVAMYNSFDSLNLGYCKMIDTVFLLMKNSQSNTGKIYYLARKLTMMGSFIPSVNAKTYLQMTSTGAFRLIKNRGVSDSIAQYYQLIKSFEYWSDLQRTRVNNIIATNDRMFSADAFLSVYKAIEAGGDSLQHVIQSNPSFASNDQKDINAAMMHYQYFYGFLKLMNGRATGAAMQARKLIALLEKEFDLGGSGDSE